MTGSSLRDADADLIRRLEDLAGRATVDRTPWPGVDEAVRRSRRLRLVAGSVSALALVGVLALLLPAVYPRGGGTAPAGPGTASPAPGSAATAGPPSLSGPGDIDQGQFAVQFGAIKMDVTFEIRVGSSEPMSAGGGECAVFDHPLVVDVPLGGQVDSSGSR